MEEAMRRHSAIAPLRDTPVPKTTLAYEQNYARKSASQSEERWAPGGECSDLVAANDEATRELARQAEEQGLNRALEEAGLSAGSANFENAKEALTDYAVEKAGAEGMKAGLDYLQEELKQIKTFAAFMKELKACAEGKGPRDCLLKMAAKEAGKRTKDWLVGLADSGTKAALDRVEKFHKIYTGYVNKLQDTFTSQSTSAAACLGKR